MNTDGGNERFLAPLVNGFGNGEFDWLTERLTWGP